MSTKYASVTLAVITLTIWCVAQNPPASNPPPATQVAASATIPPVKLAVLNIQQAIMACDEGKREDGNLQQFIENKNGEAQKLQKELDTLKNTFEVQGTKLSDEARADMAEQIDAKDTYLQRFQQDAPKDIDRKQQRGQTAIAKKMLVVIGKVAKEKGVNMVQFYDVNRDGYVDPALFITDDVVKAYNLAYPVMATPLVKK
jgi:Skp family chaperone for outer membrane proteins